MKFGVVVINLPHDITVAEGSWSGWGGGVWRGLGLALDACSLVSIVEKVRHLLASEEATLLLRRDNILI